MFLPIQNRFVRLRYYEKSGTFSYFFSHYFSLQLKELIEPNDFRVHCGSHYFPVQCNVLHCPTRLPHPPTPTSFFSLFVLFLFNFCNNDFVTRAEHCVGLPLIN